MGNALLYSRYQVDLGYRVGHYNGCVQFECNDRYHYIFINKNDSEWTLFVSLGYIFHWVKKGAYVLMT